ncbi:hypothetical protein T492DRAFT_1146883, partial [Pavlovales sp. CCMP2436]
MPSDIGTKSPVYLYLGSDDDYGRHLPWLYLKVLDANGAVQIQDNFTDVAFSQNFWQVDPRQAANHRFLGAGTLRMRGRHKIMVQEAFSANAFRIRVEITAKPKVIPDNDRFAIWLCDENADATTSSSWSEYGDSGCVRFDVRGEGGHLRKYTTTSSSEYT